MKKIYICILALVAMNTRAQVNGEFENWSTINNYQDPTGWVSFNLFSAFGDSLSCLKHTPAYSGTYSLLLRPFYASFLSDTTPGVLLQNSAYTSKPNSFRFAYNYTSPKQADTAYITVQFYKGSTEDPSNVIGYAEIFLTENTNWEKVQKDITWLGLETPDTAQFYISTSNFFGARLLVDDISLSAFSAGIKTRIAANGLVFTNSDGTLAWNAEATKLYDHLLLYNAKGQLLQELDLADNCKGEKLAHGIYFYTLTSKTEPEQRLKGKLLVH